MPDLRTGRRRTKCEKCRTAALPAAGQGSFLRGGGGGRGGEVAKSAAIFGPVFNFAPTIKSAQDYTSGLARCSQSQMARTTDSNAHAFAFKGVVPPISCRMTWPSSQQRPYCTRTTEKQREAVNRFSCSSSNHFGSANDRLQTMNRAPAMTRHHVRTRSEMTRMAQIKAEIPGEFSPCTPSLPRSPEREQAPENSRFRPPLAPVAVEGHRTWQLASGHHCRVAESA